MKYFYHTKMTDKALLEKKYFNGMKKARRKKSITYHRVLLIEKTIKYDFNIWASGTTSITMYEYE